MDIDELGYMFSDLFGALSGLILPVILLVGGFIVYQRLRRAAGKGASSLAPSGDPMRYALASAVLKGSPFRRKIIGMFENPFTANGPELGIDLPVLVSAARRMEAADKRWQWTFFLLLVFPFLIAPIIAGLLYSLLDGLNLSYRTIANIMGLFSLLSTASLLAIFVLAILRQWTARFRDVRPFRRDSYDADAIRQKYPAGMETDSVFVPGRSNLLTFGTNQPFVGLGFAVNAWQVAVDLSRPSEPASAPEPVTSEQVYSAVHRAVAGLNLPGLETARLGLVNGTESSDIPEVQADRFKAPIHALPESQVLKWRDDPNSKVRVYEWYRLPSPDEELQFNYLFRCTKRGQSLFVEAVQTFLPPVERSFREVDFIRRLSFFGLLSWGFVAVLSIPLVVFRALIGVAGQVKDFISNLFGGVVAAERLEIKLNPAYNYGARETIREHIMAPGYQIYFQRADGNQFNQALDQQALNAIRDLLDNAGIDSRAFGEQANSIQQSNVIISSSGGGITIGNGASIGNVVSNVSKSAQRAIRGSKS